MRQRVWCAALAVGATLAPDAIAAQITLADQHSGTTSLLIAVSAVDERIVWVSGQHGTYVRTTDGGATWSPARVQGADSLQFRDVYAADSNTAYLLSIGNGDQSRIYKTTDAGAHWTLQLTNSDSLGFFDCMDFWDRDHGIMIGDAVKGSIVIHTTSDGGVHWTRVPSAKLPPAQDNEGSFAASGTCLVTRPGGRAWIVASNEKFGRVLRTSDFGATWAVDTLPVTTRAGVGPQSITFRDDKNGFVLGGGYKGQQGDVIGASTGDGGRDWMPGQGPPFSQGVWGAVYIPGSRVPTIVAVGPQGLAYTRDGGASWTVLDRMVYWSVGFASKRAGWAVGAGGRITRLTGF
jgi:photosystem II stability/assembly factor-like uncharacterized protein